METKRPSGMAGGKLKGLLIAALPMVIFLILKVPMVEAQFLEAGVAKFKVPVEPPDFTLKVLNGERVSFKELKGKVIIVNFFGTR